MGKKEKLKKERKFKVTRDETQKGDIIPRWKRKIQLITSLHHSLTKKGFLIFLQKKNIPEQINNNLSIPG